MSIKLFLSDYMDKQVILSSNIFKGFIFFVILMVISRIYFFFNGPNASNPFNVTLLITLILA